MTEREMEDLLWEHPDKFLNETLTQFQRQPSSLVGRADVIFKDRIGRLLVIELKRDILERGAIMQLVDYYGMLKTRFPSTPIELMVIAARIPPERRLACEQYDITAVEIPQKRFRDVAEEVGYVFKSEVPAQPKANGTVVEPSRLVAARFERLADERSGQVSNLPPSRVEKSWYYWESSNGRGYYLAFVNAKGSCSMRRFEARSGAFQGREYGSGDYQLKFSEYLRSATPLHITQQPNLEKECKIQLPARVLTELQEGYQRSRS